TFAFTSSSDVGFGTSGTGGIPSFTAVNNGTAPITTTVTVTGTANGCPGPVQVFTITVNPSPVVNAVASLSVCNGAPVSAIAFSSPTPGATFQYTTSVDIGFGTTGVGNIPAFTADNTGATPLVATVTVTANAQGCAGPAQSFSITVNPSPTVNTVNNFTYCNGATTQAVAFGSPTPGTTFSYTATGGNIGLATTGTGNLPSFIAVNNTTAPITTTVTVVATANGCPGPAQTFTFTIQPSPTVNPIANVVVCDGATVPAISFTSPTAGATIRYTSSSNLGFGFVGTNGISSFVAVNNSSAPISTTVTVVASTGGCDGPAQTFVVTINPSPQVAQVPNYVVCNGATAPAIEFTSATPGATFSYTVSGNVGFGTTGTGNINAYTAVNNTSAPITVTLTVVAMANGCPGPAQTSTITINPSPVIAPVTSLTYCDNAVALSIPFTSSTPGAVFNYTSSVDVGFGTSGTGNIPGFIASNEGTAPLTATVTVVATGNGCQGPAQTFTVTVNPLPAVNQVANVVVCNGQSVPPIPFNSATTGATFSYTVSGNIGLAATTGTGGVPTFVASNTTTGPITVTLTVQAVANGCPGPLEVSTITVNPTPLVNAVNSVTICNGQNTTPITFSSPVAGATFSYTSSTNIGFTQIGTGAIPSFRATNATSQPLTTTISVVATGNGGCPGPAQVFTITVLSNAITASIDTASTAFNTATTVNILANDRDNCGGLPATTSTVTITLLGQPSGGGGTVVLNANGTVTFTPATGFAGGTVFSYRICDITNPTVCDTAFVGITVGSAAPIATPDQATTAFNQRVDIDILSNDVNRNFVGATTTNVTTPVITRPPANGTATLVVQNDILLLRYTPNSGFAGGDTLIYRICDVVNTALCDTALVTITVGSIAPTAVNDDVSSPFNQQVSISVLNNDVDRRGQIATVSTVTLPVIVQQPTNGTVVVNGDGSVFYRPNAGFAGTDTFLYRICDITNQTLCDTARVTVTIGSSAPTANPDVVSTPFNQNVTVNILANDLNRSGQPANLTNVTAPVIVSQPRNGTAVINADRTLTYNPNDTFAGRDTLIYRICDVVDPTLCDTALVVINVQSAPPVANRDNVTTAFNQAVTVPVLTNDRDKANQPASLTNVTAPFISRPPSNGTAVVNSTGSISYTPNAGFAGSDSLIYRICDRVNTSLCDTALVVFNVGSAAPTANRDNYTTALNTAVQIPVLLNDLNRSGQPANLTNVTAPVVSTQPSNGTAVVNPDGSITYTPAFGFAGADQFIYRICDVVNTALCDTALVVVNVGSAAPRANPDVATVTFNQPVTVNVLANDADRNGTVPATLATVTTPVILSQPASGTAVVNANGSISFTPATGFAGSTTLVYQICDRVNTALCDTARVTFNVGSA
ncbi:beta strand repeat-containing protein, partial [Nibrella viscosa]|uniref:beta strand repeat-containing protein n=1 Tax=Nibrella viscosa TaxID=1084524 RepID=UPI0031E92297